jgi:hypothetical protein
LFFMKTNDRFTDTQIVFIGSFAGYLLTALVMFVVMRQLEAFKLAGFLFVPFALSTFLICRWFTPKIVAANTLQKARFTSILAATLTSLLTGALTGLVNAITHALKFPSTPFSSTGMIIGLFIGAGIIYSLPGILILGPMVGNFIYKKNHS